MAIDFGKIEKLYIQAYTKAEDESSKVSERFQTLINPETYSLKYKIEYCETQAPGTSSVSMKFNKMPPQDFHFDFLFDGTGAVKDPAVANLAIANPLAKNNSVADQVEKFKHYVMDYKSELHRPYYLKIYWGTLLFKGYMNGLDIEFKLFRPDGTPLRAVAKCSFHGSVDEKLRVAKEDPRSPDITHERISVAGDRLELMATKIYDSKEYYTDVATANNLDSFRNINPGTKILFPPVN